MGLAGVGNWPRLLINMIEPTQEAVHLRERDFDPNYVPSYATVERQDSGKKIRTRLRNALGSNQLLLTVGMMAGDKVAYRLLNHVRSHKTLNSSIKAEDAAVRITRTYHHYLLFGRMNSLTGKICEIGPGDTAGVSLLALRYGAETSDLVERFDRTISVETQAGIYQALSRIHDLDQFKTGDQWRDDQIRGIRWIRDSGENHLRNCLREGKKYDTLISNAVLEHLDDPLGVIQIGVDVLNDHGVMLHQIDLDDHGIYSSLPQYYDDLSWLETPDWLYRRFAQNSGRPNRILFHQYRKLLQEMKQQGKIRSFQLIIRLVAGVGRIAPPGIVFDQLPADMVHSAVRYVDERKSRLARSLRDVPSLELAIRGFFATIQK